MNEGELRKLPGVDAVLERLDAPHRSAVDAARQAVEEARAVVRGGAPAPDLDSVARRAEELLAEAEAETLRPVINATGVLVHTNLGRVPLGAEQLEAVRRVGSGYSNLEYQIGPGRRGSRYAHAAPLIDTLIGSEASLVVNNNAAAVLLMLAGLAHGREVIISRGELIEIGGEFRIPDVMEHAGVRLVEVGTTNRTHLADYERAITPDTAAILKVHPSNYRMIGFTAAVPARQLARLARGRGVCFLHDLGSGFVEGPPGAVLSASEVPVSEALREGADLVTFSGDKLLGGPQAGVIAGRADLVGMLAGHPLVRALRVDKMTLAALEATLRLYLEGRAGELPLWEMAGAPLDELEGRARVIAGAVGSGVASGPGSEGLKVDAVPVEGVAGGGSLPGETFPSWAVSVEVAGMSCDELARRLRLGEVPIVGRIEDDRLLLDLRTVPPASDALVIEGLKVAGGSADD